MLLIRTPRLPGCAGGGTLWSASVPAPRPHEVSSSWRLHGAWTGRVIAGTVDTKVSTDVRLAAGNCDATALAGYWSGGGCHTNGRLSKGAGLPTYSPGSCQPGPGLTTPSWAAILSSLGTAGRKLPEEPRAQGRHKGQRPPVIRIGHRKS